MANNQVPVQLGNGCVVTDDMLYIAGFPDALSEETRFTRLFHLVAGDPPSWGHQDWNGESTVALCLKRKRADVAGAGCAMSDEGYLRLSNSAGERVERIPGAGLRDIEPGKPLIGKVRGVAEVGKALFVCGYGGQIYRRDDDSGWSDIAPALRNSGFDQSGRADGSSNVVQLFNSIRQAINLEAIDGTSENDIYTCGLAGKIYHFDGTAWNRLASPTSENLLDLHCVSLDEVWISGYNQTLLRGNARQGFSVVHDGGDSVQFYSVRKFQDKVYIGTTQGLWRFNGRAFDIVEDRAAGFGGTTVVQQIDSVSDNYLWIIGDRHVYRYDGERITPFLHPDNV